MPRRAALRGCIIPALLAGLLAACSGPAARVDALARDSGFQRLQVPGDGYTHVAYRNHRAEAPGMPLHVYIEGDGRPWRSRHAVAADPTPDDPLMLRLMALDPAPALYLGRPCYLGLAAEGRCNPWLWTHGRYGEAVVASMVAALDKLAPRAPLVLIGHSGGGTLAMLLAARLPRVQGVVTLGGNLDVAAWTARHGFTPLRGSLDPARQPPLPARVWQRHYVGAGDDNVPPAMLRAALARQPGAELVVLPGVAHRRGWTERWPALLDGLDREERHDGPKETGKDA